MTKEKVNEKGLTEPKIKDDSPKRISHSPQSLRKSMIICLVAILGLFSPFRATAEAEPSQASDVVGYMQATEPTVVYSMPGYEYATFTKDEKSGRFKTLINLGLQDLIPEKVGRLKKGQRIEVLGHQSVDVEQNQTATFFRIRYEGNYGLVEGFVNTRFFAPIMQSRLDSSAAPCDDCTANKLSPQSQATGLVKIASSAEDKADSPFKDMKSLDLYLKRYRKGCTDKHHDQYLNEYKAYIEKAAKTFAIPQQFLTCLLFKENQFSNGDISRTGALGIAQFMPGTIDHINSILKDAETMTKKEVQDFAAAKLLYEDQVRRGENVSSQTLRDYLYASEKLANYNLFEKWKLAIDGIKQTTAFKTAFKDGVPWTDQYPTRFTEDRARIPALAIAASAMYIQFIMRQFRGVVNGNVTGETAPDPVSYFTLVAGAYNTGPNRVLDFLGKDPEGELSGWVKKVEGKAALETKVHMQSIQRCMKKTNKGEKDAPLMMKSNKGVSQNACA